jgi:transposase
MAKPLVSDELWELVEPLIPEVERRYRFPGRKRIDDRKVLTGILYVLPPAPSAAAAAWRRPYHSRRPPPRTARPRHQRPDQPAEAAARLRARHSPLGRRAHALLVAPIPPPARPLQTPRRHPRRVRADRRLPDLPQAPPSRGVNSVRRSKGRDLLVAAATILPRRMWGFGKSSSPITSTAPCPMSASAAAPLWSAPRMKRPLKSPDPR